MIDCKFSSFILNIKEKGRRVINDNYVNSCSREVLTIGDKYGRGMRVRWARDACAMCVRWARDACAMGAGCVCDVCAMGAGWARDGRGIRARDALVIG
jgi:hypothetical protein